MMWKCPKCGKPTVHKPSHYRDGTVLYIHQVKRLMLPFPHDLVMKSCGPFRPSEYDYDADEVGTQLPQEA